MKKIVAYDKKNGYIATSGCRFKNCQSFKQFIIDEMNKIGYIEVASVPTNKKVIVDLKTLKVKYENE